MTNKPTTTLTLTRHQDIQKWVAGRAGLPAIRRVPDRNGVVRARLALNFERQRNATPAAPTLDDTMSPVSWTAWLAELDRQQLALRIIDEDFEFVDRKELN
jgi:hypothetical protein